LKTDIHIFGFSGRGGYVNAVLFLGLCVSGFNNTDRWISGDKEKKEIKNAARMSLSQISMFVKFFFAVLEYFERLRESQSPIPFFLAYP
jgi:hypothetical protein